jgi:DNA (cytosine-5)-methyltransferase 1
MTAYYNEIDPFAADWLEELITAGAIAPGVVDRRDIRDVVPQELKEYTQCHFFAGIGVWSHALRLAGWPDSRPVWTGSCPCQPFSAAGRNTGFADERHLWPAFHWLISECRPPVVFGEQVGGTAGERWLDVVSTDLETQDYAVGSATFPACSVGAPHIRQRMYWMADRESDRWLPQRQNSTGSGAGDGSQGRQSPGCHSGSPSGGLADSQYTGLEGWGGAKCAEQRENGQATALCSSGSRLADSQYTGLEGHTGDGYPISQQGRVYTQQTGSGSANGCTGGFWADCEWLPFRDGKYRPVEPGTFPLAHRPSNSLGRLRGYGNAIVAPQAEIFIRVYREMSDDPY